MLPPTTGQDTRVSREARDRQAGIIEVSDMRAEPRRDASSVMRPVGEFSTQVMRRHVDLVRVSSALCRAASSY